MKDNNLTYHKSGVNIKGADRFVDYISKKAKKQTKSSNFKNIGGFGAINQIPKNIKNPILVTCTDGVGTKLEIANTLNKYDTIGIDLVAMSVNDLIVQGAKPHIFLDYISIDKINLPKLKKILTGILKGCKIADCELVGGETAEMPGTYTQNKFDLAGFAVGFVEKNKLLTKKRVRQNNLVIAIPSNGIHSNGYSLVRKILKNKKINLKKNNFLKNELIKPTKIYVKEILNLVKKNYVNACVNITGGGLEENIKRIIPNGLCADINLNKIKILDIFKWIKKSGVTDNEMIKTFNCGVGFCIIIKEENLKVIEKYFKKSFKPYVIGKIINGKNRVKLNGKLIWEK